MNIPPRDRIAFRANTCDYGVYSMIVDHNEYALPNRFDPEDIVIDVGVHIGSFSLAAAARGAGMIHGIEADRENFEIASRNLRPLIQGDRVQLRHGAVWRSDDNRDELCIGGYPLVQEDPRHGTFVNTGGGEINSNGTGIPTPRIAFDTLIDRVSQGGQRRIRLLKLDCEGSEWPILFTSRTLSLIDEILGEYHEYNGDYDSLEPIFDRHESLTVELLRQHLTSQGFAFKERRSWYWNEQRIWAPERIGLFWARREP